MWFFVLLDWSDYMEQVGFKEEEEFLSTVLLTVDGMIADARDQVTFFEKEMDELGVGGDKEDRGHYRKYKEAAFKNNVKVKKLESFRNNTHFGRMDLTLEEEQKRENLIMYLGEKGIANKEGRIIVYDWRSPVGNLYYMNNQD